MSGLLRKLFGGRGPTAEQRAAAFWRWFQVNAHRLRMEEGPAHDGALEDLQIELDRASRGLTFELGGGPDGPEEVLAISADGRKERFAEVEWLVAAAPQVQGFRIVAFRQKKDVPYDVELGDIHFHPAEVYFELSGSSLTLYLPGLTPELRPGLEGAARLALEDALGERDAALRIHALALRPAPADPEGQGLRRFTDLAAAMPTEEPARTRKPDPHPRSR